MAERFRDTSADVTLYVGPERVAVPAHSQLLHAGVAPQRHGRRRPAVFQNQWCPGPCLTDSLQ